MEQAQLFGKLGWVALRALATFVGVYSSLAARTRCQRVQQALRERGIDTDAAEAAVWKEITAGRQDDSVVVKSSSPQPPPVNQANDDGTASPRTPVGTAEAAAKARQQRPLNMLV